MDIEKIIHSFTFTCGLVGVLMSFVALISILRNRRLIKERTGIAIIVVVLLLALLVLTVNIE